MHHYLKCRTNLINIFKNLKALTQGIMFLLFLTFTLDFYKSKLMNHMHPIYESHSYGFDQIHNISKIFLKHTCL